MSSVDDESGGAIVRPIGESLFEVTLSRSNREALFSGAAQRVDDNEEEAELIIKNLDSWAPQLKPYLHLRTSEQIYDVPFRVVCESDLGYVPFDEGQRMIRQYLAISYCWRFPDGSGETWPPSGAISTPAKPWPVSRPFVDAILAERGVHTGDSGERSPYFCREGIWFDQVCIRQEDPVEKMRSIAMMEIIYKSCRKLLIVLEDVVFSPEEVRVVGLCEANVAKVYEAAVEDKDPGPLWEPASSTDRRHVTSLVRKIERSRWWSRAWCWHEFEINEPWSDHRALYYAHTSKMIVGTATGGICTVTSQALITLRAESKETDLASGGCTGGDLKRSIRWTIFSNDASPYRDPTRRGSGAERSSIMARFYVGSSSNCTVPADLISMTINVSHLSIFFTGSISDLDEIDGHDSWLSNTTTGIETNIPKFQLDGVKYIHKLAREHIILDLVFFEAPVHLATPDELQWSHGFFPDTPIRSRIPKHKPGCASSPPRLDADMDHARRIFFINACKNGLAYICRLWETLDEQFVQRMFDAQLFEPFTADESDRPIARKLLLELLRPDDLSAFNSTHYENVLVQFLSFIRDPRSTAVMSSWTARIACNSEKGGAAMVLNPILREGPLGKPNEERWRLAIPRDLLGMPWHTQRVWILEPCDRDEDNKNSAGLYESPSGKWRLIGKVKCLGEPRITSSAGEQHDGAQLVTLKTHQLVMG